MKYFFLSVSLFLIGYQKLYSQQLITNDSIVLKRGFYKDFYEFKYNKPSMILPPNYPVFVCEQKFKGAKSKESHLCFMISVDQEQARALRNIYGFCDGKDIYIPIDRSITNTKIVFEKLIFKGRYSLFQVVVKKGYIPAPSPPGIIVMIPTSSGLSDVVIDLNTGQQIKLKNRTLKSILKNDSQILNNFNSNKDKKNKLTDCSK